MADVCVEAEGLTRRFGNVLAVDKVDLAVPRKSIFGFLGPNGAGKTTTIKMLLGLIKPDQGFVRLNGHNLATERRRALASVGSIVETPALYSNLTGREIMLMAARLLNVPKTDIAQMLELVELSSDADRMVKTYSLGMKQRLALARALLGAPRLLILDEPINGLDPAGIADMRVLLGALPSEMDTTIIISSHILAEVEQIATHCALINKGRIIYHGDLDTLRSQAGAKLIIKSEQMDKAVELLEADGRTVSIEDDVIVTVVPETEINLSALLEKLVLNGAQINHFEQRVPALEDVFLNLTGKSERASA